MARQSTEFLVVKCHTKLESICTEGFKNWANVVSCNLNGLHIFIPLVLNSVNPSMMSQGGIDRKDQNNLQGHHWLKLNPCWEEMFVLGKGDE